MQGGMEGGDGSEGGRGGCHLSASGFVCVTLKQRERDIIGISMMVIGQDKHNDSKLEKQHVCAISTDSNQQMQ